MADTAVENFNGDFSGAWIAARESEGCERGLRIERGITSG
jgi:hypothetical protein